MKLSQKVGLIFHGIGTGDEPFPSIDPFRLRIMAGGNQVVGMSTLLVESPKLNHSVAHHIGIGCETCLHLFHCIASHLLPVCLMTVYHLESTIESGSNGGGHFQVFLRRTVPFLVFLGANLDVEAVGLKS